MDGVFSLADELKKLRKNFHLKLAKKRGLEVRGEDFFKIPPAWNDNSVQSQLERMSAMRRIFFIGRFFSGNEERKP